MYLDRRRIGYADKFNSDEKYTQISPWNEDNLDFRYPETSVKCHNCTKARALKSEKYFQTQRRASHASMKQVGDLLHFHISSLADAGWATLTANNSEDMSENLSLTPAISHVMLAPTNTPSLPALPIGETIPTSLEGVTFDATGNATASAEDLNSFYFYEFKYRSEEYKNGQWRDTGFTMNRKNICETFFDKTEIWYDLVKGLPTDCLPKKGTEQFAVLWILFAVIVLGNTSVLVAMLMNKNRKSRMNFFIKQLALADLSVGLLNVLTDIIWRITISWRAGNVACKAIRFSQVCVTYASTYVLVALSIDRYDAITHPMNFSKSWKRANRLVASAWVVSALFSAPMLFLYEEKLIQGQTQCWIELGSPWRWQVYMSLVSVTLFAIPALIITACYAVIVRTIWIKGAMFTPAERAAHANPATRRASSRGIIPRAKVKTVKMTFVIVIVFILCWSPYIVFDLLQVFGHIPRTQTNIAIATLIQSLAPLNSAANPLIYCLFSTQIFRTLSRIPPFKWFQCCCKSRRTNSTQSRCNTVGQRLHNSCDSMRTLTTSLTVSRRSNKTARVVIVERPKTVLALSEV